MDPSAEILKTFLEVKPASQKVIRNFKPGVEVGIQIRGGSQCAYFNNSGRPCVELRAAKNPDVIFEISPEAVAEIAKDPGEEVGTIGICIVKQILEKNVHIRVPGSLFSILKNGYMGVIADGGAEFAKFLASNGIANVAKIPGIIKNLKKDS